VGASCNSFSFTLVNIFAIGDVQGCFENLSALLDKSPISKTNKLWFVGDLVNRGPKSLEVLRWCYANKARIQIVLGNHDLHLMALYAGVAKSRPDDTLSRILRTEESHELIDWLRAQPLAYFSQGHLLVHAGVLPHWSVEHALELSDEVSKRLRSQAWKEFLASMYGNTPSQWHPGLRGDDRARVIVNAMTRLRFCTDNGEMEFNSKEGAANCPHGYKPWFKVLSRMSNETPIVFGHWSTLKLLNEPKLLGIDTGCIWGGPLTAVSIVADHAKRQFVQVPGVKSSLYN
jgi:bis(5'-nucleosyl)-tetraphosphatase (symmetrical)